MMAERTANAEQSSGTTLPKRRRWRPRFSLRALFVVMTLACTAGWYFYRCEAQRQAARRLQQDGGWVNYKSLLFPSSDVHGCPTNLKELRLYLFESPTSAHLWSADDAKVQDLLAFPRLPAVSASTIYIEHAWYFHTPLPDPPVPPPGHPAPLKITNEGLRTLARLRYLEEIGLAGCVEVNDEGARHLASLPRLKELTLDDSLIGNEGLRVLAQIKTLRMLALPRSKITDKRLSVLYGKPLTGLDLSQTAISSEAIAALLPQLPELRELKLSRTEVGDELIPVFEKLPRLEKIDLTMTQATANAATSLPGKRVLVQDHEYADW
jgi:hypothetical protein